MIQSNLYILQETQKTWIIPILSGFKSPPMAVYSCNSVIRSEGWSPHDLRYSKIYN